MKTERNCVPLNLQMTEPLQFSFSQELTLKAPELPAEIDLIDPMPVEPPFQAPLEFNFTQLLDLPLLDGFEDLPPTDQPVIAGGKGNSQPKKNGNNGVAPVNTTTASNTTNGNAVGQTGLPPVPGNLKSPSGNYVIAYYADVDGIGHGFIKVRPYEQPDAWKGFGFYPEDNNLDIGPVYVDGDVDNDTVHMWNSKVCYQISEQQLREVLAKVAEWEDKSYILTGPLAQNCVSFVEDVSATIGTPLPTSIDKPSYLDECIRSVPQSIQNPGGTTSTAEVREKPEQIIDARR